MKSTRLNTTKSNFRINYDVLLRCSDHTTGIRLLDTMKSLNVNKPSKISSNLKVFFLYRPSCHLPHAFLEILIFMSCSVIWQQQHHLILPVAFVWQAQKWFQYKMMPSSRQSSQLFCNITRAHWQKSAR